MICDAEFNSSATKQTQGNIPKLSTRQNNTDEVAVLSVINSSSEKSGRSDDRENENPDQPKSLKRRTMSRDFSDVNKSKILKENSASESFSSAELSIPLTPVGKNELSRESFSSSLNNSSNQSTTAKDYFSLLPDEVLLLIFKAVQHKPTLINCACVCRRWKNIAYDVDSWSRIELSQYRIEPGVMEVVLKRKPVILRMCQTKVITPIFKQVADIVENVFSKIEYLDLSMASISPDDLELLLRTCYNLLKLSLEYIEVNEAVCKEIAKNSKLTVLNLAQTKGLAEPSLYTLLTSCEKLTDLNIGWTHLNAAAISCVCQNVPKCIQRLNLSGCLRQITDHHVKTLVLRCNKLKELDLSDGTNLTQTSVQAICDNLNNLEVLSLSRCYNIFPGCYSKLFNLPCIAFINLFGLFTESQVETLRKTSDVKFNMMMFSYIARPTVGNRRTSIWGMQVRD